MENCSRQETAAAPGQGIAWGKSVSFSKNPPSEEFVPERWRMEIPMGSAPACLMDSPQHQFGWYSGCCDEFLRITIRWDNDFRCTGHFHVPALLQHLRVTLLTLQTEKLRHRTGSGEGQGSSSTSWVLHGCCEISITHNLAELPKVPPKISYVPSVPSSAAMSCCPWSPS